MLSHLTTGRTFARFTDANPLYLRDRFIQVGTAHFIQVGTSARMMPTASRLHIAVTARTIGALTDRAFDGTLPLGEILITSRPSVIFAVTRHPLSTIMVVPLVTLMDDFAFRGTSPDPSRFIILGIPAQPRHAGIDMTGISLVRYFLLFLE